MVDGGAVGGLLQAQDGEPLVLLPVQEGLQAAHWDLYDGDPLVCRDAAVLDKGLQSVQGCKDLHDPHEPSEMEQESMPFA